MGPGIDLPGKSPPLSPVLMRLSEHESEQETRAGKHHRLSELAKTVRQSLKLSMCRESVGRERTREAMIGPERSHDC